MLAIVTTEEPQLDIPPSFDDFWIMYPRHVAKKAARCAWARVSDQDKTTSLVALFDWRRVWEFEAAKEGVDHLNFLPHPATWLNGERWEDELPAGHKRPSAKPAPSQAVAARVDPMPEHVRALLAKLRMQ